ncbi:MAG: hypothetical protein GX575_21440 [Candidatus Anammoximicrobium sp.]|nr:hypothetical protein [Candidatus Anammoximicrobium sp.]
MNWRWTCGWILAWVSLAATGPLSASQASESAAPIRFSQLGAPAGLNQYMPQTWGVVAVSVVNTEEQPVDVLAAFGFSRDPDIQFARRIWLPPQAVRRTWVPVQPPRLPPGRDALTCYGMLIDERSGAEVVLRAGGAEVQHTSLLRVNRDRLVTGALMGDEALDSDEPDYAYEALIALRTARGYGRGLALIDDRNLPPLREVFDGLDQLVLWNDRFASDGAILSALRSWLNGGGELWIMLDRVDFAGVERLLGETFTCHLVNRVALDQAVIQSVVAPPLAAPAASESYEQPLDFVRVIVTGMEVTHTVQGWPAAFWRDVGRGRVVFTTVGGRAWIRAATAPRPPRETNRTAAYEPTREFDELPLFQERQPPLASPDVFCAYLSQRIGYRIASRGPVGAILGLFCVGLLVAGVVLARRRRLEHLAWLAPGLGLLAAVPLAGLGMRSQRAVPATVGEAQFVEVADGAGQFTATGLLACYDPVPAAGVTGVSQGGVVQPDEVSSAGTTRRMVWTDLDQWHWERLRPATGLRMASFQSSRDLPERLEVRGTFTAEGFAARWTGKTLSLTDPVIVVPGQSCLAVRADGSRLLAGPQNVLAPGRYVEGRWLSDEQHRRQAVMEKMLQPRPGQLREITRPLLLGWSEAVNLGFQFSRSQERFGTALWALPLRIDRPRGGTRVVIPAPFLSFSAGIRATDESRSPLYDRRAGVWIASQKPTETWLRFQVPDSVLPFRIQTARLTVQVTAPSRRVQIVRRVGERTVPLRQVDNPIGQIQVTLQDATLPDLDPAGRLLLGILVDPIADGVGEALTSVWKIDTVQVEVAGTVLPAQGE